MYEDLGDYGSEYPPCPPPIPEGYENLPYMKFELKVIDDKVQGVFRLQTNVDADQYFDAERAITERSSEALMRREKVVEEKQKAVKMMEEDLDRRLKFCQKREETLKRYKRRLRKKNKTMNKQIDDYHTELGMRDAKVLDRETRLVHMEKDLNDREQEIETREKACDARSAVLEDEIKKYRGSNEKMKVRESAMKNLAVHGIVGRGRAQRGVNDTYGVS